MTAVAALLALAVAASPSTPPRRTGADLSNAARAKVGLLPRKVTTRADARGRRIRTIQAPAPTYLAEPAPLADDAPADDGAVAEVAPVADADPDAAADAAQEGEAGPRVAARAAASVVRLPSPDAPPADEPPVDAVAAVAAPEEVGGVRVAAAGVVTEVTLRLRFDP